MPISRAGKISLITAAALASVAVTGTVSAQAEFLASSFGCLGCILIVSIVPLGILINAFFLRLATKVTRLDDSMWTAIKAVLLAGLLSMIASVATWSLIQQASLTSFGLSQLLTLSFQAFAVQQIYGTTYLRSLATFLLASLFSLLFFFLCGLGLVGILYFTTPNWNWEEQLQELTEREEWQQLLTGEEPEEEEEEELPGTSLLRIRQEDEGPGEGYRASPIKIDAIGNHLGEEIRLILADEHVVRGVVEKVEGKTITVLQKIGGGTVTIPVRKSKVLRAELIVPE